MKSQKKILQEVIELHQLKYGDLFQFSLDGLMYICQDSEDGILSYKRIGRAEIMMNFYINPLEYVIRYTTIEEKEPVGLIANNGSGL